MLRKWLALCFFMIGSCAANAQVEQARIGGLPSTNVGISFSSFNPDFTLKRLYGFGAYANVMPLHYGGVDLGLEGELKLLSINQVVQVHERTLSLGVIGQLRNNYYGFKPYGKFMYGLGNFYYPNLPAWANYRTDSFGIFVLGGGVDHQLHGRFSIRGDYEYQRWTHFRGGKTLNPNGFTVGVSYKLF
ncbi:MAG TPA: outer membrane beta-barrel protein [Acidisarcina sp.]